MNVYWKGFWEPTLLFVLSLFSATEKVKNPSRSNKKCFLLNRTISSLTVSGVPNNSKQECFILERDNLESWKIIQTNSYEQLTFIDVWLK